MHSMPTLLSINPQSTMTSKTVPSLTADTAPIEDTTATLSSIANKHAKGDVKVDVKVSISLIDTKTLEPPHGVENAIQTMFWSVPLHEETTITHKLSVVPYMAKKFKKLRGHSFVVEVAVALVHQANAVFRRVQMELTTVDSPVWDRQHFECRTASTTDASVCVELQFTDDSQPVLDCAVLHWKPQQYPGLVSFFEREAATDQRLYMIEVARAFRADKSAVSKELNFLSFGQDNSCDNSRKRPRKL